MCLGLLPGKCGRDFEQCPGFLKFSLCNGASSVFIEKLPPNEDPNMIHAKFGKLF